MRNEVPIRKVLVLRTLPYCYHLLLAATLCLPASAWTPEKFDAFLAQYCYDCHGEDTQKADLDLEKLMASGAPVAADGTMWMSVLDMLKHREMPPPKKAQPSEAQRDETTAHLKGLLEKFAAESSDPGRVTARRLNRAEYNNTIRDLFAIDFEPAENFPRDDVGYGFDNIGDVLSLSPLLMEKYLDAAEQIVEKAVLSEEADWPPNQKFGPKEMKGIALDGRDRDSIRSENSVLGLFREGEAQVAFEAAADGTYEVIVDAYQQKAGPGDTLMAVKLNEGEIGRVEVKSEDPREFTFEVKLKKGKQTAGAVYTNNYVNNDHPDPNLRGDRNMYVRSIRVVGPLDAPKPEVPESHRRLIPEKAKRGQEEKATRQFLTAFATKAYRRPATRQEVARLARLSRMVRRDGGTFEEGMKIAAQAVLASPKFLFRWESDPETGDTIRDLNGYEIASRLSYFLWSSMPDSELFALAGEGKLTDREVIGAQVDRMLEDPKASAFVTNFSGQWLQTRNLDTAEPDPERFPEFDDALRFAMEQETERFFGSIVTENRSVLDLLGADYTFLNERLAKHYDIDGVAGEEFRRVKLEPGSRRGGILTHASILTITSDPRRTSPVNRGKWVLEQILGTPPPPPPPDVPDLEESTEAIKGATLRERLEEHRKNPSCAGCHAKMDPLGFALENFDAIGRWRNLDGDSPIDPSGELPTGERIDGVDDLRKVIQNREEFVTSLAEKLLTYGIGRGLEFYDRQAVTQIVKNMAKDRHRFRALVREIVQSEPFLKRKVASPEASP